MQASRVWLIRHGQTNWNTQHRWQGHVPTPLNARGLIQAEQLGEHLKGESIHAVYSSDLPRAYQTAEAIAAPHRLQPIADERLREINVGVFQGLFPDEIEAYYPQEITAWRTEDFDYAPPNGESRRAMQDRAVAAFHDLAQRHHNESIAIVSHGGTLRLILRKLFEQNPAIGSRIPIPNTSYTVLDWADDAWHLTTLTAVDHLSESLQIGGNTGESAL